MVTDRERAQKIFRFIVGVPDGMSFSEGTKAVYETIEAEFAAVRREVEAKYIKSYTHDDMDCACENGRLEERGKWSAVAKAAYAELVGYHIKNPLPEPIKGYVCQGRVTLERLGILLGYIEPGHFTKIGTDN